MHALFQIWYDLVPRVLSKSKYVTTWSQTNMAVFGKDQFINNASKGLNFFPLRNNF